MTQYSTDSWRITLVTLAWVMLFVPCGLLAAEKVLLIYPDTRGPYRNVFIQIIEGIRHSKEMDVELYGLNSRRPLNDVQSLVSEKQAEGVIVLGRKALAAAGSLRKNMPVVKGAVLSQPGVPEDGIPGISLVPDPMLLFGRLKQLAPNIKNIVVVYNPATNSRLVRLAKRAARVHGMSLRAIEAANLKHAAAEYRRIMEKGELANSAIWLPQDRDTVDKKLVLPALLAQAWKKKFVVFSSNPAFVRRGVLFSLYPDNDAMGRRLAALAIKQLSSKGRGAAKVELLRDLKFAVNLRTASHLGLELSAGVRRNIDLVFPSQ